MTESAGENPISQVPGWTQPSVIALLLANVIPLFGVLFLRWEVFPLLLLFWFENVMVGISNVLKMLLAALPPHIAGVALKLFLIPFFCVHYGMFTTVHGIFVIMLFGGGHLNGSLTSIFSQAWSVARESHLGWAILGLALSHGISFAWNYLWRGEYKRASVPALMTQPYGRVMVLHLTILGGGFLLMALHSPVAGLVLLVALKTALDLRGHRRERKKFSTARKPIPSPALPLAE